MTNLFDSFVKKAIKNNTFLDINRPNFDAEMLFGLILQESALFLCLKKFTDEGEYDGVSIIRKEDILYFGMGGNRRSSIRELVEDSTVIDKKITINLVSIRSIIESVASKFGYLSIYEEEYSENFYVGEVLEIDDNFLLLHEYGPRNSLDRSQILLRLDSITRIEVDGKYEKSILKSFSNKPSGITGEQ